MGESTLNSRSLTFPPAGPCTDERADALHLVFHDHVALVESHTGLCEDAQRMRCHGKLHAAARGNVGLVARAALVGLHAVRGAVEDALHDVLDSAEIGGFDLDHMAGAGIGEVAHVLKGIAPFVGHDPHRGFAPGKLLLDGAQTFNLPRLLPYVHGAFDVKPVRPRVFFKRCEVRGDAAGIVREDEPDGSIDIDVEVRQVARQRRELPDPRDEPSDVFAKLLSVPAQLFIHRIDETVGKGIDGLQDHLVDVLVAVVARLAEDRHGRCVQRQPPFPADHLAAGAALAHARGHRAGPGSHRSAARCAEAVRPRAPLRCAPPWRGTPPPPPLPAAAARAFPESG